MERCWPTLPKVTDVSLLLKIVNIFSCLIWLTFSVWWLVKIFYLITSISIFVLLPKILLYGPGTAEERVMETLGVIGPSVFHGFFTLMIATVPLSQSVPVADARWHGLITNPSNSGKIRRIHSLNFGFLRIPYSQIFANTAPANRKFLRLPDPCAVKQVFSNTITLT